MVSVGTTQMTKPCFSLSLVFLIFFRLEFKGSLRRVNLRVVLGQWKQLLWEAHMVIALLLWLPRATDQESGRREKSCRCVQILCHTGWRLLSSTWCSLRPFFPPFRAVTFLISHHLFFQVRYTTDGYTGEICVFFSQEKKKKGQLCSSVLH